MIPKNQPFNKMKNVLFLLRLFHKCDYTYFWRPMTSSSRVAKNMNCASNIHRLLSNIHLTFINTESIPWKTLRFKKIQFWGAWYATFFVVICNAHFYLQQTESMRIHARKSSRINFISFMFHNARQHCYHYNTFWMCRKLMKKLYHASYIVVLILYSNLLFFASFFG